ncbi:MAG: hypothetical protein ABH864_02975 [archaeon]
MEVEVKIPIGKSNRRVEKFFEREKFLTQENWVYPVGRKVLRIRKEGKKGFLTIKGKNESEKFNSREESEIEFESECTEIVSLFDKIFGRPRYYSRKRASVLLEGTHVLLDVFENGNTYVEVEGDEKGIISVLEKLDLNILENERRPYYEIEGDC